MRVIFGRQTGKLLYLGIHNKLCASCAKGNKHTCFKHWKEFSSSMEMDIIFTGFKAVEVQHGVRHIKFIRDGDSFVYPTLIVGVSMQ